MKALWLMLGAPFATVPANIAAQRITVLSSRADMVSAEDALISVALPRDAKPADVTGGALGRLFQIGFRTRF